MGLDDLLAKLERAAGTAGTADVPAKTLKTLGGTAGTAGTAKDIRPWKDGQGMSRMEALDGKEAEASNDD